MLLRFMGNFVIHNETFDTGTYQLSPKYYQLEHSLTVQQQIIRMLNCWDFNYT